ncbi:N-acetylmuramoyl-L-alanine amidase [Bradyrhizobium sp. Ai1a-2]|uniref:N-acetylmuramoyl-L-alanine amidase n=1 Tax=Bradyrhizobium sp. Ai1a-2 TaxID=196490 RepID=UPI0003F53646|nr:N-acetylmuramoyl-L-alanine amidase [Bradyrhizobium sp. Ai1a-2]
MIANQLLQKLATIYQGEEIRYPQLRAVTLAQWILESGRATSKLAKLHYNFGGIKWRREMAPFATRIAYEASDGVGYYCKFATIESFIAGYWAFLNRSPYTGWEEQVETAEEFIRFIGPIYTPTTGYVDKVLDLVPEAQNLLNSVGGELSLIAEGSLAASATDLGTIVIDPGHGGTVNLTGSSANNAISKSGVKEKKLTLDFCLTLREELLRQTASAGESIKVVLTRTTDVNLSGPDRARTAFTNRAKLFLCLHFNGLEDASIRGTETFFRAAANTNLNLQDDIAFATDVHNALFGAFKSLDARAKDRGIKPDTESGPGSLGVMNDHSLGNDQVPANKMCRSAYIEAEFITNAAVDKLIVSGPEAVPNRTKLMAAVAQAIRSHMRGMLRGVELATPHSVSV